MRLAALHISNFACIDEAGINVHIDDIVTIIGPNNCGKSSILDAYEEFAGTGSPLPLTSFHNEDAANNVAISGVFTDITAEDLAILGEKWKYVDEVHGECVKAKWEWESPGEKGKKYSWDPAQQGWVSGGMGGWDTLITSRIPVPLRIKPTDNPEQTEQQIKEILTAAVKSALKADGNRAANVVSELSKLTDELAQEVQNELDDACDKISTKFKKVFPDYEVSFQQSLGKVDVEKLVGSGSHIRICESTTCSLPLSQQGAGVRRTFLWSALGTLAEIGRHKQGRTAISADRSRILLIEEPESFLHPPMVRAAREALYELAEVDEWQVMACTHSPVFVDVSKPHTTIVRVRKGNGNVPRLFCTDKANFTEDERTQLAMVRACHPSVNEFFFADHVFLVEGETEQAVIGHLLSKPDSPVDEQHHIVNCMGKGNLPLFARILNQFGTPYTIVHDADSPKVKRDGNWITNGMWTMNQRIVEVVAERDKHLPQSYLVVHVPHFEGFYFSEELAKDKPFQAIRKLNSPEFDTDPKFVPLRQCIATIRDGSHVGCYKTFDELQTKVEKWVKEKKPEPAEAWRTR